MIIDYPQIQALVKTSLAFKIHQEILDSTHLRVGSIAKSFVPEVFLYAKEEKIAWKQMGTTPSFGIFSSVNLYNGQKDLEQNKINYLNYELNNLEFKKNFNELVSEAQNKYWEIIKYQEYVKILNDYDKINKNNRVLILRKVTSGLSPKSEEFIFKKIEMELQEDIIKSEYELLVLKRSLAQTLSLDKNVQLELNNNLDISKFNYDSSLPKIDKELILTKNELSQSENKLSGLWRMPKINFYVEKSFSGQTNGEILDDRSSSHELIGIKVTLPLLSEKNNDSIEEQVKKRELAAAHLRSIAQIAENEANLINQEINFAHLLRIIEISKNKIALSKEIFDKTFSEFRIGLKEAVSLNEATVEYVQAKKDLIEHQIDYILAIEHAKVNNLLN